MTGGFEALIDGLGNLIGWLLIAPFAAVVEGGRRLWSRTKENKSRSTENDDRLDAVEQKVETHEERLDRTEDVLETHALRLTGDDDDPNNPGALKSINNLSEQVDHLEEKVDENHGEIVERLDRMSDSESQDEQVEAD